MTIEKQREVVSHEVVINSAEAWAYKLREDARLARLNGDIEKAQSLDARAIVTISAVNAIRTGPR